MTIESAILENITKLPDSVKNAVLLYTEFLASQYHQKPNEEIYQTSKKTPLTGSMRGTFILPLPDDFDEPLADLSYRLWD